MSHAIRIHRTGGPEVLGWEPVEVGAPAAGQVRLRHTAIGVNFIDVYHRAGLYSQPLPFTPGAEGVGIVQAVGPGVSTLRPGDRVGYAAESSGGYSEERLIPAARLLKLPESITDQQAAGVLLRGMTVEFLIRRAYAVKAGECVLLHAAAGGVGSIAVQWLKALGAVVIGTAGSAEKCALVKSLGADHALNYRSEDWVARVRELTHGEGVHVVYDGVGKDTCVPSMDCLRPRGHLITFGNASGAVPPIAPLTLTAKGSLHLTRPTLHHYIATRDELEASAAALFDVIRRGHVKTTIGHCWSLREAASAHRELEARRTTGPIVLIP
jgi:NADPH2:quinone reductase